MAQPPCFFSRGGPFPSLQPRLIPWCFAWARPFDLPLVYFVFPLRAGCTQHAGGPYLSGAPRDCESVAFFLAFCVGTPFPSFGARQTRFFLTFCPIFCRRFLRLPDSRWNVCAFPCSFFFFSGPKRVAPDAFFFRPGAVSSHASKRLRRPWGLPLVSPLDVTRGPFFFPQ